MSIKKIKVLEVIRQGKIGGGESHLFDLFLGLDRTQIEPIALSFTDGYMIEQLREHNFTCHVIETFKQFDISIINKVISIVKSEKIDLIHAHGSRAALNMLLISLICKIPMIYTVHGWSFHQDQSAIVYKLRALSEKIICKYSKRVICVSDSNRKSGIETFGLKDCTVIENGINLNRFDAEGQYKDLRTEFGFSSTDIIVGLISRITKQKDPITFIKSIEIANSKDSRIKGVLIGEGDMDDEVNAYISQHHLEPILHRFPFRNDVPAVLNTIDIYCLPSLWEGLSIALLEAMAMKKAIVVTPTDGTKEIIQDGYNGLVVDYNNPQKLADAYNKYVESPEIKISFGSNAYKLINERFSSRRVADMVCKIYNDICR